MAKKSTPYFETDLCTAKDYYGITKYLGELHCDNALTIRTSIIGNEIKNKLSLVEWFLRQENSVQGLIKSFIQACHVLNMHGFCTSIYCPIKV
jgi:dTDP-4-dehydrorhamnose reductase